LFKFEWFHVSLSSKISIFLLIKKYFSIIIHDASSWDLELITDYASLACVLRLITHMQYNQQGTLTHSSVSESWLWRRLSQLVRPSLADCTVLLVFVLTVWWKIIEHKQSRIPILQVCGWKRSNKNILWGPGEDPTISI
jgi:hypothetical protein